MKRNRRLDHQLFSQVWVDNNLSSYVYLVDRFWLEDQLRQNQVLMGLGQLDVMRRVFRSVKKKATHRAGMVPKGEYYINWIAGADDCASVLKSLRRQRGDMIDVEWRNRVRSKLDQWQRVREYEDKTASMTLAVDRDWINWGTEDGDRKELIQVSVQVPVEPGWERRVAQFRRLYDQLCADRSITGSSQQRNQRLRARLDRVPDPE